MSLELSPHLALALLGCALLIVLANLGVPLLLHRARARERLAVAELGERRERMRGEAAAQRAHREAMELERKRAHHQAIAETIMRGIGDALANAVKRVEAVFGRGAFDEDEGGVLPDDEPSGECH